MRVLAAVVTSVITSAVALAALLGGGISEPMTVQSAASPAPAAEMEKMQLVVSPHPDDELLVWSALEDDTTTYTVFVVLTRGERTQLCAGYQERTQVAAGEVEPSPAPTAETGAALRLASAPGMRSWTAPPPGGRRWTSAGQVTTLSSTRLWA